MSVTKAPVQTKETSVQDNEQNYTLTAGDGVSLERTDIPDYMRSADSRVEKLREQRIPTPSKQGVDVPDAKPIPDTLPNAQTQTGNNPAKETTDNPTTATGDTSTEAETTGQSIKSPLNDGVTFKQDGMGQGTVMPKGARDADWQETVQSIKDNQDLTDAQRNKLYEQVRKDYGIDDETFRKASMQNFAGLIQQEDSGLAQHEGVYYEVKNGQKVPILTEKDGITYACINGSYYKLNNATGQWEAYQKGLPQLPDDIKQGLESDDPKVKKEAERKRRNWEREQDDLMREEKLLLDVKRFYDAGLLRNGDNLRTVLGTFDLAYLQKKYGTGILRDITGDKLLRRLEADFQNEKSKQVALNSELKDAFRENKLKGDRVSRETTVDGQPIRYKEELRNGVMDKLNELALGDGDSDKLFMLAKDGATKEFQEYMFNIINDSGLYKSKRFMELFPGCIDENGKLDRKVIDGYYGNNTLALTTFLLGELYSPEELALKADLQINPETGELEPWKPDTLIEDLVSEDRMQAEADFERRRNERQKSLASIGSLVMTIGDTIGTASGLKAADRGQINEMQDNLEKKYYEIKNDYDRRLDALRQEREKARSDREKQQFDLYMKKLGHEQNKEMLGLQQAYNATEKAKDRDFTGRENSKDRDLKRRIAQLDADTREAIAKAKASGSTANLAKDFYQYSINGQKFWLPKTQKGIPATILNSAITGGWTSDNLIKTLSEKGKGDTAKKLIENALSGTFPNARGELKLDDNNVILAINNLIGLKGKPGINDDAIDEILKNFSDNLVKQGAFTDGQMQELIGVGGNVQDDSNEQDEQNDTRVEIEGF